MMIKAALLVSFTILAFQPAKVSASQIPQFTSCVNPQGEIKASYETGTHGIAGRPGLFEGKDTVYTVASNAITQCFCPTDGNGVQTNFWKIPVLTQSEINVLEAQGWIYIPNGALWGLESVPYMAKNSDYSCKATGGGNGSGGSGGNNDSGSTNNSSGGGSSASSSSGGVGQVLGLASTGNTIFVLGTALTSGISLLLGLILKRRTTNLSK
jgi:uncharacterized membrane protein YgcG